MSAHRPHLIATIAALAVLAGAGPAHTQMSHDHADLGGCKEATLACATKVTPAFGPDGALWLVFMAGGRVSVARSDDLARSFAPAGFVDPGGLNLDWGPDARPKIAVDTTGRITVAFAHFKDKAFNAQVLFARSSDGGKTFSAPRGLTSDPESQRFEALAVDPSGAVFAAWLDKRNRAPARARGQEYVGAALAYAWSEDGGETFSQAGIAHDNTCECCRLGVGFAGPARPVVLLRNVFDGRVRDHAIVTFRDPATPGPVERVAVDDWAIDSCPHHGPSLAVASDGTYHVTWYTNGRARKGLFYAHSGDGGRSFSTPMRLGNPARNPSRPFVLAGSDAVWLAWKEFDGERTTVNVTASRDGGKSWSPPRARADTIDTSDHPLLATDGRRVYLSWQTRIEGYRLLPLEGGL
jgi:hypothetical protein